jgi:hypothetical protein
MTIISEKKLDWTIVRPVGLTDKNDILPILYNLKVVGKIKSMISRNEVAHFILDSIEKGLLIRPNLAFLIVK